MIVLVITIIIMIIIAAAIILSLSSSGIIGQARNATSASDVANAKQVVAVAKGEYELGEAEGYDTFKLYAEAKLEEAGYKVGIGEGAYEVTEDGTVYPYPTIPEGFVASKLTDEDNVSEGLVIYEIPKTQQNSADWTKTVTLNEKAVLEVQTKYNQYVWVPVDSINTFVRKDWKVGYLSSDDFANNTSDYDKNNAAESKQYNELLESIKKNGGFYIARFEAGLPTGVTLSNVNYGQIAGEEITDPVSVKGASVWYDIPWDLNSTIGGSWDNPGCAKVAKNIYSDASDIVSHLIYGAEWDAALKFISKIDSTYATNSLGKGWYVDNYQEGNANHQTGIDLGTNAANKLKNIYDMAGNMYEWTMEVYTWSSSEYCRMTRGGCYGNKGNEDSAGVCYGEQVGVNNISNDSIGFRIALYLK